MSFNPRTYTFSLSSMIGIRHYWRLGLNDSLLGEAVLCSVGCVAAPPGSTYYMLVAPALQLWQPEMSADIARCLLGGKITPGWEPQDLSHPVAVIRLLNFNFLEWQKGEKFHLLFKWWQILSTLALYSHNTVGYAHLQMKKLTPTSPPHCRGD